MESIKLNVCLVSSNKVHQFQIVKGSGTITGTPDWKCVHCNQIIKSS